MTTQTVTTGRFTIRIGDRVFFGIAVFAGVLILVALAAVAIFLVAQSIPALVASSSQLPHKSPNFLVYVWPLVFGTIWASILALIFAIPLTLGIALFISHYANRRISTVFGYLIDLLAAIPSVVYGLWGIAVLAPLVQPLYAWLVQNLGWFPLFAGPVSGSGRTILTGAIVLAIMILPIMTAICREIFLQTPRLNEEAALALGATRWEMIRLAVIPHARAGIGSAIMLGLGRALGETLAIALVLSPARVVKFAMLTAENPNTIAANIALQFPESTGVQVNALIASGLVLFFVTLLVNTVARYLLGSRLAIAGGR